MKTKITKKLMAVTIMALSAWGCSSGDGSKQVTEQTPDFIHATYYVADWNKSAEEIEQADFETFQFMYVMAAPQWNRLDFSAPMDSVLNWAEDYTYATQKGGRKWMPQMMTKAQKKGVKVLLSFAGEGFNPIVEVPEKRERFIAYMAALVEKFGYDGIEIDWESGVELGLHAEFVHGIRLRLNELGKKHNRYYFLTTALHNWQRYTQALADQVAQDLDWINIMTYDMGGGIWGKVAKHNTPLADIKQDLEHWKVFDKKKLCIGLASYGFHYKGILPEQEVDGKLDRYGKYISYNEFAPFLNQGWTEELDEKQRVNYYFSPDRKEFVTMENRQTIAEKIDWIYKQQYKGVFWWEYHYDFVAPEQADGQGSHVLTDVVKEYLLNCKEGK